LLEVELGTGRTHQIRAHFKAIDHPVLGDDRYGDPRRNHALDMPRLFLHAAKLSLPHHNGTVEAQAPLPADLAGVLAKLR
jgi:23S rRNA-/tRNA-specific pseudouridylate synthase